MSLRWCWGVDFINQFICLTDSVNDVTLSVTLAYSYDWELVCTVYCRGMKVYNVRLFRRKQEKYIVVKFDYELQCEIPAIISVHDNAILIKLDLLLLYRPS